MGHRGRQRPRYGLVATVDGHGQMVGHAGLERELDRPERAEVALEIADAMQGKGLGTVLLCQLAEAANELGIQVMVAEVLPENRQMLRVFRDCAIPSRCTASPGWSWSNCELPCLQRASA